MVKISDFDSVNRDDILLIFVLLAIRYKNKKIFEIHRNFIILINLVQRNRTNMNVLPIASFITPLSVLLKFVDNGFEGI